MSIHPDVKLTDWNAQTRAVVLEVDQLFPGLTWGTYNGHDPSKQRAGDGMVPGYKTAKGIARGTEVAEYLWAHRVRLNIWYVIWRGRIISRTYENAGWRTYYPPRKAIENSPDSAYHRNHPHFSTYPEPAEAYGTVWLDRLQPGVTDSESVRIVQRALGCWVTGAYDEATISAARVFQRITLGDAPEYAEGVLGKWQTTELLKRRKVWATLRLDASGEPAPPKVPEAPTTTPEPPAPPVVVEPEPEPPKPVELYPIPDSGEVYLDRLQPGVTGSDSVAYVQMWLAKVLGQEVARSGAYDDATQGAVKAYQREVLGDAPEYTDGVLGRLQTVALAKAAEAEVTIYADSKEGGQVWPEVKPPAKPPTPPASSRDVTVGVATWNVHAVNSLANMRAGLLEIHQAGMDAVGLQELSDDAKMRGLKAYAKSIGWASTSRNSAVTCMWNTKTTDLVRQDYTLVQKSGEPWEDGAGGDDTIYKILMEVILRDRASGREWVLLNHHLVPTVESGGRFRKDKPKRVAVFKRQISVLRAKLAEYGAGGRMVAVTADWNVAWGTEAGDWLEAQLDGSGATMNWDEAPDQDTHTGPGVRAIDGVAVKNGWPTRTRRLGRNNSDHYAVAVDLTMKG